MEAVRRTQAERRESTRGALLDATIECLARDGYAKATTRRIAMRAGVTPGALQYHFATKAQLVGDTMRHVMARFAGEMLAPEPSARLSDRERDELLLDRMWQLHNGSLFQAVLELLVAARTDPEIRSSLVAAQRERSRWIETVGPTLYPELSTRLGFADLVMTGQATMRGLAMLSLAGDTNAGEAWVAARSHLLALADQLPRGPGTPS
jgi:AcrR family transcriptional regulator